MKMASAAMPDEVARELKEHPERFALCPSGNYHRLKGDNHAPELCWCSAGTNGSPVYRISAANDGQEIEWMHVANANPPAPKNATVVQKHRAI